MFRSHLGSVIIEKRKFTSRPLLQFFSLLDNGVLMTSKLQTFASFRNRIYGKVKMQILSVLKLSQMESVSANYEKYHATRVNR